MLAALVYGPGLWTAGPVIAGDDGPRVGRHDEARLSAGSFHTCAVKADGDIHCWGDHSNAVDQTGPYVQVSAGTLHTCAVEASGDIHCWGDVRFGKAADQTGPYEQVSAGDSHTCAVKASGDIHCWGDNSFGQSSDQTGP
jgi:alpha-tubulin suppressor-like RCC1 family protein